MSGVRWMSVSDGRPGVCVSLSAGDPADRSGGTDFWTFRKKCEKIPGTGL